MPPLRFIYINAALDRSGVGDDDRLRGVTVRHKICPRVPLLETCADANAAISRDKDDGVVFEMVKGWASLEQIRLARSAATHGKRVWFFWPAESTVEAIDEERLRHYRTLYAIAASFETVRPVAEL